MLSHWKVKKNKAFYSTLTYVVGKMFWCIAPTQNCAGGYGSFRRMEQFVSGTQLRQR